MEVVKKEVEAPKPSFGIAEIKYKIEGYENTYIVGYDYENTLFSISSGKHTYLSSVDAYTMSYLKKYMTFFADSTKAKSKKVRAGSCDVIIKRNFWGKIKVFIVPIELEKDVKPTQLYFNTVSEMGDFCIALAQTIYPQIESINKQAKLREMMDKKPIEEVAAKIIKRGHKNK